MQWPRMLCVVLAFLLLAMPPASPFASSSISAAPGLLVPNAPPSGPADVPTPTPFPTDTDVPSSTPFPTDTDVPTLTPYPTDTNVPTSTPFPTDTNVPTLTPFPTDTNVPTPTPFPTDMPTTKPTATRPTKPTATRPTNPTATRPTNPTATAIRAATPTTGPSTHPRTPVPRRTPQVHTRSSASRIAFSTGNGIATINPDGTGIRQLTFDPNDAMPRWSPDGRAIAFARKECRGQASCYRWHVYRMNADGTHLARIGPGGFDPVWSPDGTRIAFVSCPIGRGDLACRVDHEQISVMNANGSGQRDLTTRLLSACDARTHRFIGYGEPAWAPDGTTIAFVVGLEMSAGADGCGTGMTNGGTSAPQTSIMTLRVDGSRPIALTHPGRASDSGPAWSPDGQTLAFTRNRVAADSESSANDLALLDVRTGRIVIVPAMHTDDCLGYWRGVDLEMPLFTPVAWSPDGRRLADGNTCQDYGGLDIVTIAGAHRIVVKGTHRTRGIGDPDDPAWAPFIRTRTTIPGPVGHRAPTPTPHSPGRPTAVPTPKVGSWNVQELSDPNLGSPDRFGGSVALSADGRTALVGANGKVFSVRKGSRVVYVAGAVYVFVRGSSGWSKQAVLQAGDNVDQLGSGGIMALSADGGIALIGGGAGPNIGAAYVFVRRGGHWSLQAALRPADAPSGVEGDEFGTAVALSADGHRALIGAPSKPNAHYSYTCGCPQILGAVYVFGWTGHSWSQQAERRADEGWSRFGASVALSGDGNTALVGAPDTKSPSLDGLGAVYVFGREKGDWRRQAKFFANNDRYALEFGSSVALTPDGGTAIVGADGGIYGTAAYHGANVHGAVYVFGRTGSSWGRRTELHDADGVGGDQFGSSVAVNATGNTIVIGAANKMVQGHPGQGQLYVFRGGSSGWRQQDRLYASDGASNNQLGLNVALSADGNTVISGVPDAYAHGNPGVGYVFMRGSGQ